MTLADNKLHPLQIENARDAAFRASEKQKDVEDALRDASRELADAERTYRRKLTLRILDLHRVDGLAITMCGEIARGEDEVSDLRHDRDVAAGVFEAAQQQAFRRGADRKDVNQLLVWSMYRDLRTDAPPPEGSAQSIGGRRAA